jgi:hypothetical protein
MPAFRSVMSVLVRFVVRNFSTNSRPALRAPPAALRPGNNTTVTGEPASPSAQSGAQPLTPSHVIHLPHTTRRMKPSIPRLPEAVLRSLGGVDSMQEDQAQ